MLWMKRRDLLIQLAFIAETRGVPITRIRGRGGHDVYRVGDVQLTIPRHNEISEHTAQSILKRASR